MQYTSCFIGIPLPEEFEIDFREAANEILNKFPGLRIVDMRTPHITIYYLNQQSQLALENIETKVKEHINLLVGCKIEVGGMGTFGGNKPKVVYVKSECSKPVYKFHDEISKEFKTYGATDNDFGFTPHITIARVKEADRDNFQDHKDEIGNILSKVKWNFEVKELCVYGVDSRRKPEHQRKLLSFEV